MFITLIGMSGSGKSHWSKRLVEDHGFRHFCCDDLIEEQLEPVLRDKGYSGLEDIAKWMGQPYEPRGMENQQRYLNCEIAVMQEILKYLNKYMHDHSHDVVIDTSGSVIYTGEDICRGLTKYTRVVYLEVPETFHEQMLETYLESPKPVIWGDVFEQKSGETNEAAIARCYPELLRSRARLYREFADVTVEYETHRDSNFSTDAFLKYVYFSEV